MKTFKYDEYSNVNDTYEVKRRLGHLIEELIDIYESDITKFYSHKKIKSAGTRARVRIRDVRAGLHEVWGDIQKQKQDYESDYE